MANTFKMSKGYLDVCQKDLMRLTPAEMAMMTDAQIDAWNEKFMTTNK